MSTICCCCQTTADSKWKIRKKKKVKITEKSNKCNVIDVTNQLKEMKIKEESIYSNIFLEVDNNEVRRQDDVCYNANSDNSNCNRDVI